MIYRVITHYQLLPPLPLTHFCRVSASVSTIWAGLFPVAICLTVFLVVVSEMTDVP